jgi:hypothetical protein
MLAPLGRSPALLLGFFLLLAGCAVEPPPRCTGLPGHASLTADLYFGRAPVTDAVWRDFLATVVTPRFPAGLTFLDGTGQWRQPESGRIVAERATVLRIITDRNADTIRRLEEIRTAYRERFAQDSVGLVTAEVCASF